jgi:Zn-dependent protease with chaperone function
VTAIPTLAFWLEALLVLLIGGAVLVGLAAVPARWTASGVARRTLWQAATLGLAALFVTEVAGLGGGLAGFLHSSPATLQESEAGVTDDRGPAEPTLLPPTVEANPLPAPAPPGTSPAVGPTAPVVVESAVWWPGVLWLAGTVLVLGRVAVGRGLLFIFRRRHRPVSDPAVAERVRRVAERLGLRRRVLVLEADALLGPVAFGIVRPTVALPGRFATTFTPAQQEVILAHELTHLAAGDPAWHLFAELVTAVLWWHPLVWWARHQLRTASELAADEASVVVADGPAVLARCLVELAGVLAEGRSPGWVRMAGSGFRSSLGRRVERLVRLDGRAWRPPSRVRAWLTLALAPAALLAAAVLSTAWARARAFPEGDVPMRHGWQRSLAAAVLVAALGSDTNTRATADPPAAPPAKDQETIRLERVPGSALQRYGVAFRAAEDPEGSPKEEPAAKLRQLRQDWADLIKLETALRAKQEAVQKANADFLAVASDGAKDTLKKLAAELDELKAKAAELEKKKAELEVQIQTAEAKATEASTHLKVFRLTHRDPEEMCTVLEALLARQPHQAAEAGPSGVMGGPSGGGPGAFPGAGGTGFGGGRGSRMGSTGVPGGGFPGGGNPFGGMAMGGFGRGGPQRSWRLAADQRTHCLIVRGTEQDIRTAGELLAMLDVSDDKPIPPLKNYRVFRLRYADPNEVTQLVMRLGINAVMVPAPTAHMVVVSGPEAAMKEIGEVLEAVDVEAKTAPEKKSKDFFQQHDPIKH